MVNEMTLRVKIETNLLKARKEKNKTESEVLMLVKSDIVNSEIDKKVTLNDSDIIAIVKKQVKQLNDSLEFAKKLNRNDLIKEYTDKISILDEFLPKMLNEDEILKVLIDKGATKDMKKGQLMGLIMSSHKDVVNGQLVNKVVDGFING